VRVFEMKDPRECKTWMEWDEQALPKTVYSDICARLDAKDAEIAALKGEFGATRGALLRLVASVRELDVAEQIQEVAEAVDRAHDVLGLDYSGGERSRDG
jgi:hypothetical protein